MHPLTLAISLKKKKKHTYLNKMSSRKVRGSKENINIPKRSFCGSHFISLTFFGAFSGTGPVYLQSTYKSKRATSLFLKPCKYENTVW